MLALNASARADEAKAVVEGVPDKGLRQAIERYIGQVKRAPQSRVQARRRAEEAAADATVVLRSEGYYDAVATPDLTASEPVRPLVRIEPGQRFLVADPHVSWTGPPPDDKSRANAEGAVKLAPGAPGRAADVVAAEGRIVGALVHDGYPDAAADPREVVADHADHTVRPTFRVSAKGRARFDGVQVKTIGRTNPLWVAHLAPWKTGQTYSPEPVAELERRLLDTGVYDSVNVSLSPDADAQGLRPVVVSLADRPKATIALGGSYSTTEGVGANARYTTYNRLRRADTETLSLQYGSILKEADAEISLPQWRGPQKTLRLGVTALQDDTDAFRQQDAGVHADLERRFGKTSFFTYGVSADFSHNDEKTLVGGLIVGKRRNLALLTGLARLSLDRSNDPLDPTRGWRFDGRVEPTLGAGDDTLVYAKAQAQVSGYLPVTGSTVLAGRLKLGSILSGSPTLDVPAPRRFFAGGGGSIRGYAYQGVGPRFPDGTPIGGQSLFETSLEVRQKFGSRFGGVAFLDAGSVSAQKYPDFRTFSAGAGIGVRYNLGFGPLRGDIAFPLNRRKGDAPFIIYISIGQAF